MSTRIQEIIGDLEGINWGTDEQSVEVNKAIRLKALLRALDVIAGKLQDIADEINAGRQH